MAWSIKSLLNKDYAIIEVGGEQSETLASLHGQCFSIGWSDGEFAQLLTSKNNFALLVYHQTKGKSVPVGFALAQMVADEAEILAIGVVQKFRKEGYGRALMDSLMRKLYGERVVSVFLEVDENNTAAFKLYSKMGFKQVAMRPDYYTHVTGAKTGARVMRLDLT